MDEQVKLLMDQNKRNLEEAYSVEASTPNDGPHVDPINYTLSDPYRFYNVHVQAIVEHDNVHQEQMKKLEIKHRSVKSELESVKQELEKAHRELESVESVKQELEKAHRELENVELKLGICRDELETLKVVHTSTQIEKREGKPLSVEKREGKPLSVEKREGKPLSVLIGEPPLTPII